jgi:hypothetical protein
VTDVLSDDEIAQRIAALSSRTATPEYRYFQPLSMAVDEYEEWATTPEKRIYLGLEAFDAAMRGTAPGEMTELVGYTQSGKTLLLTNMMIHNADKSIAWFTPDETRILVMVRLACVLHGVSAITLEQGLHEHNPEVRRMLNETAEHFPMLGVYDDGLDLLQMLHAMEEQMEAVGREPQAIVFDYAALLNHEGDIRGRLEALKNFAKNTKKPMFVVQQTSRTTGRDGERIRLASGEYSGEQQATHMIGVRRKFQYYESLITEIDKKLANPAIKTVDHSELTYARNEALYLQQEHQHTITVSLVKNKRPPAHLVDEIDFHLEAATGRLLEHRPPEYHDEPSMIRSNRQRLFGDD